MDHVAAIPIQKAAQIVECAADVDVGNVSVPMLVRSCRLSEALAFLGDRFCPFFGSVQTEHLCYGYALDTFILDIEYDVGHS